MAVFKKTCRHFRGDYPCRPHKTSGAECGSCADYAPRGKKILVIKTGSAGDVLRTTSILQALREAEPRSYVTWIVEGRNADVLAGNPFIDEVITYDASALVMLKTVTFDLAVNLDVTVPSAALLSAVSAKLKKGFALDKYGCVYPVNMDAAVWYDLGLSDKMKKANQETYHDIIHDICGLKRNKNRPILTIRKEDADWARSFVRERGLDGKAPLIGVNVGGGSIWQKKTPDVQKWVEIARKMISRMNAKFIVFGGPKEEEKYRRIISALIDDAVGAGTGNSFGRFAALINLCDVLVTPDTFVLHAAAALDKKIVALFGPTSGAEIELYGKGRKIDSGLECLCCYEKICDKTPGCMDLIDPVAVTEAAEELLTGGSAGTSCQTDQR